MKRATLRIVLIAILNCWPHLFVECGRAGAVDLPGPPLSGTRPLLMEGDIASTMVAGIDRFLTREIAESRGKRAQFWKPDFASAAAYVASVEPNRRRLAHILGVRDRRVDAGRAEWWSKPAGQGWNRIRWPAFADVTGEGLESSASQQGDVVLIVIPDAGETPEQLAGLAGGIARVSQVARRLAASGYHVIVPSVIDRTVTSRRGGARLTNREFLNRSAYELGRHILGYEVQKVLALVDQERASRPSSARPARIGMYGHGEGGAIALYAAALDPRIDTVCVSGYFDVRDDMWRQPVDRNVFGMLEQFGDAEVATLIAPRRLVVEAARGPEFVIPPGTGGAPGRLTTPRLDDVKAEVDRARGLVGGLAGSRPLELIVSGPDGCGPFGTDQALETLLTQVDAENRAGPRLAPPGAGDDARAPDATAGPERAVAERQERQVHELDRHNQRLLEESALSRQFMKRLDTSSLAAFERTAAPYREEFAREIIGRFDRPLSPPDARSRRIFDEPRYTGYEVVMDVYPDVIAYGILLMPKGVAPGEKRPVVVCQHGLEGRVRDVADPAVHNPFYHQFAVALAERGFITFAPQNLYIFEDRFRVLQRKANPLKKTLFSVMVPQHQQLTDWLKSLREVDPARIGFYGLSYGGKSAMRIPPLVTNYSLSICSADFNEWVWKNATTASDFSYVWSREYEIFEFDLGSTFNYAEMAALIAPRPFMVERGHFDGVAPDEMVAFEFAKVFHLYHARLGIGDRCEIEYFVGPHRINGQGTFRFLHRWLNWPASGEGRAAKPHAPPAR